MTRHLWLAVLLAGALVLPGCGTSPGGSTPASAPQPPVAAAPSLATGLAPASHDQVEKFRRTWNSTDAAISGLLAPNTAAFALVESEVLTSIDRKEHLPQLSWSGTALTGLSVHDLGDFRVDTQGRIADFRVGGQRAAELEQPGDGKTYRTRDGDVETHVVAFRKFNGEGGNLSTVFTVTNHGKHPATLTLPQLRAAGRVVKLSHSSLSIGAGATVTEPLSEGPDQLPPNVTLLVTLSGRTTRSATIHVPAFG